MKITAYQCVKCKDIIYSRAQHDMIYCKCGAISVDGGITGGYTKISYKGGLMSDHLTTTVLDLLPTHSDIDTVRILYRDWSLGKNKYGHYKGKK